MRRGTAALLAAGAAVVLAACGGDDGGGGAATSKADWEKDNGSLVAAYGRDLSDALNAVNRGERPTTISTCTQVQDDAKEVKDKALPVPEPAVDTALRSAVDNGIKAAEDCLKGARNTDARSVEAAQREFADARKAMDDAEAAIKAWQ